MRYDISLKAWKKIKIRAFPDLFRQLDESVIPNTIKAVEEIQVFIESPYSKLPAAPRKPHFVYTWPKQSLRDTLGT
jgi:hypothetical protein